MSNITRSGLLLKMVVLGSHEMSVHNQEDQPTIHNAVQIRKINFWPNLGWVDLDFAQVKKIFVQMGSRCIPGLKAK